MMFYGEQICLAMVNDDKAEKSLLSLQKQTERYPGKNLKQFQGFVQT